MLDIVFWGFAGIAIAAGLLVIVAKNPVRAVLALIVAFLATAVTWLVLDAEFLAVTLVLVYVGAVMVLFLFIVMMLDISFATLEARFTRWLPIGVLLATVLFFAITITLRKTDLTGEHGIILAYVTGPSNTELLGRLIFTDYLMQFVVAGILLLVAIIAAIALIYRGPQERKIQRIADQIKVRSSDRVRLVDGH